MYASLMVRRSTVTITCGRAVSACPWGSVGQSAGSASHDGGSVEAIGIAESELLPDRQLDLGLEHGPRGFVHIDNFGF